MVFTDETRRSLPTKKLGHTSPVSPLLGLNQLQGDSNISKYIVDCYKEKKTLPDPSKYITRVKISVTALFPELKVQEY